MTQAELQTLRQFGPRYSNARDHRILDALLEEILRRSTLDPGTTWWQTWNAIAAHGQGLRVTTARCLGCDGRISNIANPGRNLSRTGSPYICGHCHGTRRGTTTWVDMRPIPADVVARFPTPQPPAAVALPPGREHQLVRSDPCQRATRG